MTSKEQWAWAAGFFDGEGSVGVKRVKRKDWIKLVPRIQITNADLELIERFRDIVGEVCTITSNNNKSTDYVRQPRWHFEIRGRDKVERIMKSMDPWLGSKKRVDGERALSQPDRAPAA